MEWQGLYLLCHLKRLETWTRSMKQQFTEPEAWRNSTVNPTRKKQARWPVASQPSAWGQGPPQGREENPHHPTPDGLSWVWSTSSLPQAPRAQIYRAKYQRSMLRDIRAWSFAFVACSLSAWHMPLIAEASISEKHTARYTTRQTARLPLPGRSPFRGPWAADSSSDLAFPSLHFNSCFYVFLFWFFIWI